ncbi:MAG: ArsI/CadI family heavy metal resistance metalloenzyme [Acidobacteriota bacterium]
MKRLHVMLQVEDLDHSVRFYSTLFSAEPTVREDDYAKWMLDDPRVNFSLSDHGERKGVEHLGIQAETPEELEELRERIGRTGASTLDEGETTCCYHHSDKLWVTDGQGVSWEAFYTSGRADSYSAPQDAGREDGCCASDCCAPAEAGAA